MKAAIVEEAGRPPAYGEFRDPTPGDGEVRVEVAAAALTHLTKGRASGMHYSSAASVPFVVGVDGVGRLGDGRRVYFLAPEPPFGAMAEATLVKASHVIPIPDDLDDVTAAALANPGMSSWAAFAEVAKLNPGETALINGATGSAGRLAVQIARRLGAKRVIATGRNRKVLDSVGADATIQLVQDPDALQEAFREQMAQGVDVVVDYLWGVSAERMLVARTKAGNPSVPLRFVQVGTASGANITLPGAVLRSSAIRLMGSGLGSVSMEGLLRSIEELLKAATPAGFQIATRAVPLSRVEAEWSSKGSESRTVFVVGA